MAVTISEPKTAEDFEGCYDLRWRILRKPWGQPMGSEKDGLEHDAIHVMARLKGRVVGTGRIHFNSESEAQLRYMAVEESLRGAGIGTLILDGLEGKAREKGAKVVVANARDNALGFYKKRGYAVLEEGKTLFGSVKHWKIQKMV